MKYEKIEGGHGTVKLYDKYAVKILPNTCSGYAAKEIIIMRYLKHPNINIITKVVNKSGKTHIHMPKYDCDLSHLEKTMKISEKIAKLDKLFIPLFSALLHMKNKKVIHLDIKARNIFCRNEKLVIGDFSSACFENSYPSHFTTTKFFIPPEGEVLDYSTDVYMMGSAILFFIFGEFHRKWDEDGELILVDFDKLLQIYDGKILKIILSMVRRDPQNRPEIEELCANLGVRVKAAKPKPVVSFKLDAEFGRSAIAQFKQDMYVLLQNPQAEKLFAEYLGFLIPRISFLKEPQLVAFFVIQCLFDLQFFDMDLIMIFKKATAQQLFADFWNLYQKWDNLEKLIDLHVSKI